MNADAKKRAESLARRGRGIDDIMVILSRSGKRPFRREVEKIVRQEAKVADMLHVGRISRRWPNTVPTAAAKSRLIAAESLAPWTNIAATSQ